MSAAPPAAPATDSSGGRAPPFFLFVVAPLAGVVQLARAHGLTNVVAKLGDGGSLPYSDRCFDAVYLITVLGEIPDREAALGELRRVLKPGGRVVVGEILVDPVSIGALPRDSSR